MYWAFCHPSLSLLQQDPLRLEAPIKAQTMGNCPSLVPLQCWTHGKNLNAPFLFCLRRQQTFACDYCCELLGSGMLLQLRLWLCCHVCELSHCERGFTRVIDLQHGVP